MITYNNMTIHTDNRSELKINKKGTNNKQFLIDHREIETNLDEYCGIDGSGTVLTTSLLLNFEYDPMIYEYFKLINLERNNLTELLRFKGSIFLGRRMEICHEIMKRDVAIIKVRLESNKYSKYNMDVRLTFAEKLASFGKHTYHFHTHLILLEEDISNFLIF